MKFNYLLLAAAVGLSMASCSNEEIENLETSANNAIGFHAVGNYVTRATIIDNAILNTTDFSVIAYTKDGKPYMGTNGVNAGINIINSDGTWTYKNASDLHYWPTIDQKLDFYAVNPSLSTVDANMIYGPYMWTFTDDNATKKSSIHYAPIDEYNSANNHKNIDVMYAVANDQTKETSNGFVNLNFKHILSQVYFQAKTELANMEVEIQSIQLANVYVSGKFTIPTTSEEVATQANWTKNTTEASNGKGSYQVFKQNNGTITVNSNTTVTALSREGSMLLMPQELIKWAPSNSNTIENADSSFESYLRISCKIKQNGRYVHGSETAFAEIFIPFSANWQPGKRYVYTIIFGGGYDYDGNKILTPINFNGETTSWVDENNEIDAR